MQIVGDAIPPDAILALISAPVARYQSIMACPKYLQRHVAEPDRLPDLAKTTSIIDCPVRYIAATVDVVL